MRKVEAAERRRFVREEARSAEAARYAAEGPSAGQRVMALVRDLDEPRPAARDFDSEIERMLDRSRQRALP